MPRKPIDLTDEFARGMPSPLSSEIVIRDAKCLALGRRIRNTGARTWIAFSENSGKVRRRTLGWVDKMTVAEARIAADPGAGAGGAVLAAAPKLADFVEAYLADRAPELRPTTLKSYRYHARNHLLPRFGMRRVDDIGKNEVASWFAELSAAHQGASQGTLALLSGAMRHAERLGLRPPNSNPCRRLRRGKIGYRGRYLNTAELRAVWAALDARAEAHPAATAIVRLLIYTGARRNEIAAMIWGEIDGAVIRRRETKTGPRSIYLSRQAAAILDDWRNRSNAVDPLGLVFQGANGKPLQKELTSLWSDVLAETGLQGARLHDLRHSFASTGTAARVGLRLIGGLLGHKTWTATIGYAHLGDADLSAAADRTSKAIARSMGPSAGRGRRRALMPKRKPTPAPQPEASASEARRG